MKSKNTTIFKIIYITSRNIYPISHIWEREKDKDERYLFLVIFNFFLKLEKNCEQTQGQYLTWLLVTWSFSSSFNSLLMTTTGGALCSVWRTCETGWCGPCLVAKTSRLGIDMMMTTSSRLMCVTSTRFTAKISSPTCKRECMMANNW